MLVSFSFLQAKGTIGVQKKCQYICFKKKIAKDSHQSKYAISSGRRWNIVRFFFPCRTKNNRTLLPITMWLTALRLLAMTEITVTLMRMSASSPCCRPSLKRVLLESTRGAQRKVSVSPLIYKTGCELIL